MIQDIITIAQRASLQILHVYNEPSLFESKFTKEDQSPLTLADEYSNKIIVEGLQALASHIPIISEENENTPYELRKGWKRFWLVDPLDGTKEFLKRNGQFTVNIALIEDGVPVLGVIDLPCTQELYYAYQGKSFKLNKNTQEVTQIFVNEKPNKNLIATGSISHKSDEETVFLKQYSIERTINIGSSIKFCYLAEGRADIYYRHGPTMEWDTAAGHAIVNGAGGTVEGLSYNKQSLLNGSFVCKCKLI